MAGEKGQWTVSYAAAGPLALVGLAWIFAADRALAGARLPFLVDALLDEPAHAISAALAMGVLGFGLLQRWWLPLLAGGVLIDLDHLPAVMHLYFLTRGTPRPYTHSLAAVALVLAAALILRGHWRGFALAAAYGLAWHLFRDLAEGGAVSLLWPLSYHRFSLPYAAYATAMCMLAAGWLARWRMERLF
jgi:inner membrane protein